MTSCVRVLSIQTIDSSPSLLIVGPDGRKTLVNCGEGCQRTFLEFGQKISSIDRICLTHLQHAAIGGLPGMILTSADVIKHVMAADTARKNLKTTTESATTNHVIQKKTLQAQMEKDDAAAILPGLQLIGPVGTKSFVHSLRHFMRRDDFGMDIREGAYQQDPSANAAAKSNKKRKKGDKIAATEESWLIESIVTQLDAAQHPGRPSDDNNGYRQALSYLFTTPPILGRFLADKAQELGIPKGPLYGKLKAGHTITFPDPNNSEHSLITVESHQVVEPSCPGVVVAVLYYPALHVWQQLQASERWNRYRQVNCDQKDKTTPVLELVVHMAPSSLYQSENVEVWRKSFGTEVEHLLLAIDDPQECPSDVSLSPFHCSSVGTWMRSQLSPAIYHRPLHERPNERSREPSGYTKAVPLLEYVVIPRVKRGWENSGVCSQHWKQLKDDAQMILTKSGCLEDLSRLRQPVSPSCDKGLDNNFSNFSPPPEILFTGTGSAIPCKYRNVSGIHVRMDNGNAMLLDCGEGTVGQLLRAQQSELDGQTNNGIDNGLAAITNLKAVWISHPHADHHLGILRLLSEKRACLDCDPLILIAPPNLSRFLREYEQVVPEIAGTFTFLDCRSLTPGASSSFSENLDIVQQRLHNELGITSCNAIPVAHCQNSFAVVFHGTSFGSLAYSGDCRPSLTFAEIAQNADVLIHEATFADGLEADAVMKRHCTVGEALQVAEKMKAKTVLLSHFSQRYPKIPPLPNHQDTMTVIPAFDFMKITPNNIREASQMTPLLRLLYPDDNSKEDDNDEVAIAAMDAPMDVPGLFAQKELL